MRLDAKTVATLALDGKTDAIHFDDNMPGFGYRLRRSAGGKVLRSWVVQYKRAGATRRLLLGSAEVLSAEQARQQAKKVLGKVALGEDPQGDRRERRDKDKLSLRFVVDEYLAAKEQRVRPRTFVEVKRYLATGPYFRPLHGMPVDTVGRRDIATRLVAITREHGSVTACRARGALSAFFVWALQSGIVEANPVINTAKPKDSVSRDRVLTDAELVNIWRSCGDDDFGRIVKLLICTGCRRSEIGGLRWSELDDPEQPTAFTITAQRSKNGRAHTLPLTPLALGVIRSVPRMASRDLLFGSHCEDGFSSWVDGKRALDQRSGVVFLLHDVRRSVATKLADLGVQPHLIEQILNHVSGHKAGPAGIYNRSAYEREVRIALLMWDSHLHALIEGGERKVLHMPTTAS